MKTRIQPGMRKTLEIIALILTITFLIYGVNPKEDGKAYGFKAFAYTVTCSIQSITEGTNPQYQYASAPYEYYNTIAGGTFTVNVVASTNDPNGISSVSFPSTVSTGGSDTSYPYSWTYTWTTSSTYSSSATITCYSYWGSTGTTTLYVYRDITAPTTTATAVNSTGASYTFNTWTKSPYVNVTLTCNDASGSGCSLTQYCTDTTNTCTPTTTYTTPVQINTEGISYIRYNSTDNAGNTETTQSRTIKIDTTPPATTATAVNSTGASYTFNTWTKSPYVNVTLTCNDASGSGCSLT
ncbi:MAG: hypothetical protein QXT20_02145, partial [Candidatus Woesearchaeota archaeon]